MTRLKEAMDVEGSDGVAVVLKVRRQPLAPLAPADRQPSAVQPSYRLPNAYELPPAQVKKRQREPGAPKWTAKRVAAAQEAVAKGEMPPVLVRDPRLGPRPMTM